MLKFMWEISGVYQKMFLEVAGGREEVCLCRAVSVCLMFCLACPSFRGVPHPIPTATIPPSAPELLGQGRGMRLNSTPPFFLFLNSVSITSVLGAMLAPRVYEYRVRNAFLALRSLKHKGKDRCVNNLIQNDFSRSWLCVKPQGP